MTEPIRDMAGLVEALRKRRDALDISHETIDEISGLQPGYSGKLLAPRAPRNMSYNNLGSLLGALGVAIHVVEDPEQIAKVGKRWQKRKPQGPRYKPASMDDTKRGEMAEIAVSPDLFAVMQRLGKRGGIRSGKTRRAIAERRRDIRAKRSAAARARWDRQEA